MGRNGSIGKVGREGINAPPVDLYRRMVKNFQPWIMPELRNFFFLLISLVWQIVDRETGHEKGEEASQGAQTPKWSQRLDAQSNKTNRNYIKTPVFHKIEISKKARFFVKWKCFINRHFVFVEKLGTKSVMENPGNQSMIIYSRYYARCNQFDLTTFWLVFYLLCKLLMVVYSKCKKC